MPEANVADGWHVAIHCCIDTGLEYQYSMVMPEAIQVQGALCTASELKHHKQVRFQSIFCVYYSRCCLRTVQTLSSLLSLHRCIQEEKPRTKRALVLS